MKKLFMKMGMDEVDASAFSGLTKFIAFSLFFLMLAVGAQQANEKDKCIIKSQAEFISLLPYAIGCNLFKDRYNIKVN